MQIKLINCNVRLLALGIDMNAIGSNDVMTASVYAVIPNYESWMYEVDSDRVTITAPDGTVFPDMSAFGEVEPDGSYIG